MADEIRIFQPSCIGGISPSSPVRTALSVPLAVVERIDIKIPPGHRGLTGIALAFAGQQVIPYQDGTWLIGDGDDIQFQVESYPESGQWQAVMYNSGVFEHTWYLRFLLDRQTAIMGGGGEFVPLTF